MECSFATRSRIVVPPTVRRITLGKIDEALSLDSHSCV
jgi:hypothetical protein